MPSVETLPMLDSDLSFESSRWSLEDFLKNYFFNFLREKEIISDVGEVILKLKKHVRGTST